MYVVRSLFTCKPGRAKDLVARFKAAEPYLRGMGLNNVRIMTDTSAGFWTVVVESETASLDDFFDLLRKRPESDDLRQAMGDYMELVTGGHREVYRLE